MPTTVVNSYALFGTPQTASQKASTSEQLAEIDKFAKRTHQKLLEGADADRKEKLSRSFDRAKPSSTENYLQWLITNFAWHPEYKETIKVCRLKLKTWRQLTREEAVRKKTAHALDLKNHPAKHEQLTLSKQQQAWQRLMKTLKRCINNKDTRRSIGWHPRHHENYYLSKLRHLWQRYEMQYGKIPHDNLTETLAHEIAEERRQTVRGEFVEARQALMTPGIELTPRLTRQQDQLEKEKEEDLNEINSLIPQLILYATDVIDFAQRPADQMVAHVLDQAITEIQRRELSPTASSALFNKTTGQHKQHAVATLDKMDELREMMRYRPLFAAERATIPEANQETADSAGTNTASA